MRPVTWVLEREELRPVAEKVETAAAPDPGHTSLGRGKEGHTRLGHTLPHEIGSFGDGPHHSMDGGATSAG